MIVTLLKSETKLEQEAKKSSGNRTMEPLEHESDPENELNSQSHA